MVMARRGQRLTDHLLGTMIKVEKIVRSRPIKDVIIKLASEAKVDFEHLVEALKTSALFHDMGKALSYYQRRLETEHPSFYLHELISANIYAKACELYRYRHYLRYPHQQPWLVGLALQSVALHHQGLRTVTTETMYDSRTMSQLIMDRYEESVDNLKKLAKDLGGAITETRIRGLLKVVEDKAEEVLSYSPRLIQQLYDYVRGVVETSLSRMATGCLMIADCWDANEAVRGATSRYIEDAVVRYLRSMGIEDC